MDTGVHKRQTLLSQLCLQNTVVRILSLAPSNPIGMHAALSVQCGSQGVKLYPMRGQCEMHTDLSTHAIRGRIQSCLHKLACLVCGEREMLVRRERALVEDKKSPPS